MIKTKKRKILEKVEKTKYKLHPKGDELNETNWKNVVDKPTKLNL